MTLSIAPSPLAKVRDPSSFVDTMLTGQRGLVVG
jgi:hypothetical protein